MIVAVDIDDEFYEILAIASREWNVPIEVLAKRWIEAEAEIQSQYLQGEML